MSALFISSREPIVDLETGLCTPIWFRFFETLFGSKSVIDDTISFQVAPSSNNDALTAALGQNTDVAPIAGNDTAAFAQFSDAFSVQPIAPGAVFFFADDVLPVINDLQGQIQALRNELNDLRQGGPVL